MPSGTSADPAVGKSGRGGGLFSFTCGCKGSKSVSVVALTPHHPSSSSTSTGAAAGATTSSDTHLKSRTSTSNSGTGSLVNANHHEKRISIDSVGSSCSFSTLLRDLGELERSVIGLATNTNTHTHTESTIDGTRNMLKTVAVVAETKDPVGDFRKSMLSMIFAHDIDTEGKLWDLAIQFLNLNSPQNHPLILRAFADVCSDIFRFN